MSSFIDRHDEEDTPFFSRRTSSSSDVNSKILLIAIITLSIVVVVVTMLHVYARYILRRQARHRASLQGIGIVARIHSDDVAKRGLEPAVIASLPILMYKDIDHGVDHLELTHECTVCLGVFEDSQMVRTLPNCKHHFHAECIDKWLTSNSSCPICRHEVEPGFIVSPLPREPSTRLGDTVGPPPSAPPHEHTVCVAIAPEGTSDEITQSSRKVNGGNSRLSSFRRMISIDRSSRHVNSCTPEGTGDLERQ